MNFACFISLTLSKLADSTLSVEQRERQLLAIASEVGGSEWGCADSAHM